MASDSRQRTFICWKKKKKLQTTANIRSDIEGHSYLLNQILTSVNKFRLFICVLKLLWIYSILIKIRILFFLLF